MPAGVHNGEGLRRDVDAWYASSLSQLNATHKRMTSQIDAVRGMIRSSGATTPTAETITALLHSMPSYGQSTPLRGGTPSHDMGGSNGLMASPIVGGGGPLNYNMLIDELEKDSSVKYNRAGVTSPNKSNDDGASKSGTASARPKADVVSQDAPALPKDRNMACQVLVEFKRKRVLQFESQTYVVPGEYAVVGGDRGEDIGLVIYTWMNGEAPPPNNLIGDATSGSSSSGGPQVSKWVGVGLGKVVRIATPLEVSQLHGVQSELESRAVEVAQQKVNEHGLPMRVVDAEYQFDRKKLTFYYQSQHRLDFRTLVRDLYKTFRARIWMEME